MEANKTHNIKVRVNDKELSIIKHKCELAHCPSMSAFLRRMALHGVVVVFPEERLEKIQTVIVRSANNINQITLRYNSTNQLYEDDIADLKKSMAEINQQLCTLMLQLAEIRF